MSNPYAESVRPRRRAVSDVSDESPAPTPLIALRSHNAPVVDWPEPPEPAAFAGLAGEVVDLIDPHTEADPTSVLMHFLIGFGSAIGREPHALVGATRHGLNLYAVIVGDTSKARKGDSWSPVAALLRKVDPDWLDNRVQSGAASGEGVIHAVRDKVEAVEPIKERGRVVGHETVVRDEGELDKRLLVMEPEFARLLRVMGRQGSTVSATLRQAYDSGDLRIMSRNSPGRATGATSPSSAISPATSCAVSWPIRRRSTGSGIGFCGSPSVDRSCSPSRSRSPDLTLTMPPRRFAVGSPGPRGRARSSAMPRRATCGRRSTRTFRHPSPAWSVRS